MPVQILNKSTRDEIHRRTLAAVCGASGDPDDPARLIGRCLDFAWEGYQIIKAWPGAPRTIIQAGSAQWPRVPPEMDDGHSPTHFAYEWDPESDLARLAFAGITTAAQRTDGSIALAAPEMYALPEMHVWLGCPDTGEIIDFSTGLWPLTCRSMLGLDWQAPPPPDCFWNFGTRRPAGVNYVPSCDAIDCVITLLRRQGRRYP